MPIDELFRKFYQDRTGGAEPERELVSLFLTLIDPNTKGEIFVENSTDELGYPDTNSDFQRQTVEDEEGEIA